MCIDSHNKIVFLATPKTGSTAIENALRQMPQMKYLEGRESRSRRKHLTYREYLDEIESLGTSTYLTWGVVREPTSKFISWFYAKF